MNNYSYLYDEKFYSDEIYESYYDSKSLSFIKHNNALVLPHKILDTGSGGGVVTSTGEYLENTAVHNKSGVPYEVPSVEINKSEDKAIYLGMFQKIWGHCITDNIRRMWFLLANDFKEKFSEYQLIYIPTDSFEFSDSFSELIKILGFDKKSFIPIKEPTRFSELIIPDESFYTIDGNKRYFTEEYRKTIDIIKSYALQNITPIKNDKIYFTYTHLNKGMHVGEERLETFFKKQGYEIVAPEEFSFSEQLNMLIQCKYFASTIGSCSHNIVFMREGTEVFLIPRGNYLTGYQLAINEINNLNVTFIDANLSVAVNMDFPWCGPFFYFISRELAQCFEYPLDFSDQYYLDNFHDFGKYLELGDIKPFLNHSGISGPNYHQVDLYINEYLKVMKVSKKAFVKKLKARVALQRMKSIIKK